MAKACNWEFKNTISETKTKIYQSIEYALSSPAIAKSAENLSNFVAAYKEISGIELATGNKRPKKLTTKPIKQKKNRL